ncbi:MAG: hypothetical protein HY537_01720 [Deltaproteobacteria bacterium]|nr:hypothetical protein [Deltaproteobacteria bacterium]
MKKYIPLFVMFLGINLLAYERPLSPTMYTCRGSQGTTVGYTTTSIIGTPTFHVTYKGQEAKHGDIKTMDTAIGKLVTVEDNHLVPVDGPSIRYSLVVPHISLIGMGNVVTFDTLLVKTTVNNPFFRPLPSGQDQFNDFVEVSCKAEYVVF